MVLNEVLTASYKSVHTKNMFEEKIPTDPGTYQRVLQNTNTIQDFLTMNRWLSKGLFWYVPGVCWMFLRLFYLVFLTQLKNMCRHHRQVGANFPQIFGVTIPKIFELPLPKGNVLRKPLKDACFSTVHRSRLIFLFRCPCPSLRHLGCLDRNWSDAVRTQIRAPYFGTFSSHN